MPTRAGRHVSARPARTGTASDVLPSSAVPRQLRSRGIEPRSRQQPPAHSRRRVGTAARLAAFHALVLFVVLGAVVVVFVRQFAASYQTLGERALTSELRAYTTAASSRPGNVDLQTFTVSYLQERALPAGTVLIVSFLGSRIVGTPGSAALLNDPRIANWLAHPPAATLSKSTHIAGPSTAVLVSPLVVGGKRSGTFIATTNLSADEGQRSRVLALSIAEAAIALLAGVASAYLLLRRLLRTVGKMTKTAEDIGSGALDRPLPAGSEPSPQSLLPQKS